MLLCPARVYMILDRSNTVMCKAAPSKRSGFVHASPNLKVNTLFINPGHIPYSDSYPEVFL